MPSVPGPDPETRRQQQTRQVGDLLKTARRRAGLTQAGLAYRMTQMGHPTARGSISMWETQRMPSAHTLIAIMRAVVSAMPASKADRDLDDVLDAFRRLADFDDEPPPPKRRPR
jgi:transcriptional regulator with XRE-family HTH domain